MSEAAAEVLKCRTCGKPRGENIAHGTRCARCGHRQAAMLSIATGTGAAIAAWLATHDVRHAFATALVGTVVAPFAWMSCVFTHELAHAAMAWCLGQTVTRIVVGEGAVRWRFGRDPQLVIGSVVMGNGLTNVMDLRRRGYRERNMVMSLAAPLASAGTGLVALILGVERAMPVETAAVAFAFFSFAMAVTTLIPVPTFGGRVWSDLAYVLYLRRAGEREIEQEILAGVQQRIAILLDAGLAERAILTARAGIEAVPGAPLGYGLLAYALHHTGHRDQAAAVARSALDLAQDDSSRAYLGQFLETPCA
jgi:Zn-dependent protease